MAIRIPEKHKKGLARLLTLRDAEWTALLETLEKVPPALPLEQFGADVADSLVGQIPDAEELVPVLFGFIVVNEQLVPDVKRAVTEIREAAIQIGDESLKSTDENWGRFSNYIERLLSEFTSLHVATKASDILFEEERILVDVRIISDLRPVFRKGIDSPDAFLVAHALKITFDDDSGKTREFFFALDRDDIVKIQSTAARALQKQGILESVVKKAGFAYLGKKGD